MAKLQLDPSAPLPKAVHEAFAVHFALNGNASAAWVHATAGNPAHADANGSKWQKNSSITARVAWLKAEADRLIREQQDEAQLPALLSIIEKRLFCARLLRAKPAELERDSDLWQSIEHTKDGTKFRLPSKLDAIKIDNDLGGEGSEARSRDALAGALAGILGLEGDDD